MPIGVTAVQDLLHDLLINNPLADLQLMDLLNNSPAFLQQKAHYDRLDRQLFSRPDRRGQALFLEHEAAANALNSCTALG